MKMQFFHVEDLCRFIDVLLEKKPETKPLLEGLQESYAWYREHSELVNKKPLLDYIDREIIKPNN